MSTPRLYQEDFVIHFCKWFNQVLYILGSYSRQAHSLH